MQSKNAKIDFMHINCLVKYFVKMVNTKDFWKGGKEVIFSDEIA